MARDDSDDPSAATAVVLDTIATQTGVSASLTRSDDGAELLRVRDAQGRLLFEHNSATRLTVLVAPDGDLELRAPRGKVRVVAAEGIELSTPSVRAKVGEARVSELCVAAEGPRGTLVGGRSLRGTWCSVNCELAVERCLTGATRWSSYPPSSA